MNKNNNNNKYTVTHELDEKAWSEFVRSHPRGNPFQTPEMAEAYRRDTKHEPFLTAVLDIDGAVAGLLLAVFQKQYIGLAGRFTIRAVIYGTPLIRDDNPEVLAILLDKYKAIAKKKAIYSQFRNFYSQDGQKEIFEKRGFMYEDHLNVLVDLTQDEAVMLTRMDGLRRKNIKKAEKSGLECREIIDEKELTRGIKLIGAVYQKKKLPYPGDDFLLQCFRYLHPTGLSLAFGAFLGEELISVRLLLVSHNVIYDWWVGYLEEHASKYPNDLLPWRIMQWGKQNGYRLYDFCGAGKPGIPYGVRDFKLKFGGDLVNYGRFEGVHKPLLMKLGEWGMKILHRNK